MVWIPQNPHRGPGGLSGRPGAGGGDGSIRSIYDEKTVFSLAWHWRSPLIPAACSGGEDCRGIRPRCHRPGPAGLRRLFRGPGGAGRRSDLQPLWLWSPSRKRLRVYTSTGATAEEIAVLVFSTQEEADDARKALEARVSDQKDACEGYLPLSFPSWSRPL
ncbi:MAG: DUF4358 domain-containing protein [Intestinimonas sp.]